MEEEEVRALAIRRASAADLPGLLPLFEAYRAFYKQQADPETAEEFLRDRIRKDESLILLALMNGRPVGFTQLYPLFSSVRMGRMYLLNDLYVTDEYRRRGIAGELMAAAEQWAAEHGAVGLMLETGHTNAPAQGLYEGRGWHKKSEFFYEWAPPEPTE